MVFIEPVFCLCRSCVLE